MEETQRNIRIKVALSLNKLLEIKKQIVLKAGDSGDLKYSYSEIADKSNIRKATVSDIFNAKKSANTYTLFRIVYAMGYTLIDFAKTYEEIDEIDIKRFARQNDMM